MAFSKDEKFQRGVAHPTEGRVVLAPDRLQLPFKVSPNPNPDPNPNQARRWPWSSSMTV